MRSHFFRLVPFTVPGVPHGTLPASLEIEITGTIALEAAALDVIYCINGANERVKYAHAGAQPSRKNELWRTTCFELFMKLPGGSEYWEVNLAPSRDWNMYRFTGYRSTLQPELMVDNINIATEITPPRLVSLRATLPLPLSVVNQKLAIGISSVIEDGDGNLHYFALRHCGLKPDFHDPAGFDIILDPAPL